MTVEKYQCIHGTLDPDYMVEHINQLTAANRQLEEQLTELRKAYLFETSMLRAVRYSMDRADVPFPSRDKISAHIERLENALHTKGNYDT